MGEVERYPGGTFCWIDLGTTDVAGAKGFYGGLFGWEFEDLPADEGTYTMCRLRGTDVAGIHEHTEDQGTRHVYTRRADRPALRPRRVGSSLRPGGLDRGRDEAVRAGGRRHRGRAAAGVRPERAETR